MPLCHLGNVSYLLRLLNVLLVEMQGRTGTGFRGFRKPHFEIMFPIGTSLIYKRRICKLVITQNHCMTCITAYLRQNRHQTSYDVSWTSYKYIHLYDVDATYIASYYDDYDYGVTLPTCIVSYYGKTVSYNLYTAYYVTYVTIFVPL